LLGLGLSLACWACLVSPAVALAALDSSPTPIQVVGRLDLTLTPEEQTAFEQATLDLADITRARDLVTFYSCNRDIEHPGSYVFVEAWPSQAALEAHLQTEHFLAWWEGVKPHLAHPLDVEVAPLEAFHPL
jgi:quinol monooxygenase YgiN